jgi:hypothetical protein
MKQRTGFLPLKYEEAECFPLGSKKEGKCVLLVKYKGWKAFLLVIYEGGERFPPSEVGRRGRFPLVKA